MRRLVVLVLIASFGSSSLALAGESLRGVAERVTKQQASASASAKASMTTQVRKNLSLAQEASAVSTSGMGKGKKILIFLAAGLGVAGMAYMIDHKVEDNTPSSLGIRED
jgi:hypothetical protein